MMMYNKTVEDCFFQPRHIGVLDLKDPWTECVRSSQGLAQIKLFMQSTPKGIINALCFKATGHPYLIAGLEWCARLILGQSVYTVEVVEYPALVKELAIPMEYYPLALQVVQVYKEMLCIMRKKIEDKRS